MRPSLARFVAISVSALFWAGCGSNAPEIPDELRGQSSGFGSEPGQLAENFCFQGWHDPKAVGFTGNLESICLYDFNDPIGTKGGIELLLVNTSALWCQACRQEHQTLGDNVNQRKSRGLALVSLLFQDNERNPAEAADLGLWTRQYGVEFPMALDPLYQMGRYAPGDTAPLNLLLDAHDKMRILKKWTGNQESVIWPTIDTVLTARGKP